MKKLLISILVLSTILTSYLGCVEDGELATNPLAPVVDGINPDEGTEGDIIEITGNNLQQVDTVWVNGTTATILNKAANTLNFMISAEMTTGPVIARNAFGASFGPDLTILGILPEILIDSVRPATVAKGDSISIFGRNFDLLLPSFKVLLNQAEAGRRLVNDTLVRALVPDTAQTGNIRFVNSGDTITGPVLAIIGDPTIAITGINPTSGLPGDNVTISGQNFDLLTPSYQMLFNGLVAVSTINSPTEIAATVPPNATSGPVSIEDGSLNVSGPVFTVETISPVISSISPTSGSTGIEVAIIGENFGSEASNVEVDFNGEVATINSLSDTQIIAVVPANATTGPVSVTLLSSGNSVTGSVFTVEPVSPSITSISPTSGPTGIEVTITGANFGSEVSDVEVDFNGETAAISSLSDTQIIVTVPANATTGPVSVTLVSSGNSATGPVFTVEAVSPLITAINPTSGPVGTVVTITGQNFGTVVSEVEVDFNGEVATINSLSDTQIVTTVPANGTTGPVSVTLLSSGNAATGPVFTVEDDAPVITSINPTSGPVGTEVTILGDNFGFSFADVEVRLNGEVVNPTFVDLTEIRFIVPANATTGVVSVTVLSSGQTAQGPVFTVEVPIVTISTLAGDSPNDGIDGPLQGAILSGVHLFSNTASHQLKTVNAAGAVATFAGTGQAGFVNGRLNQAQFNGPGGIAVDAAGNIYVADVNNHVIRVIREIFDPTQGGTRLDVQTLAGIGQAGFADGDGLSAAQFNQPIDVAVSGTTLYISDAANHAIRALDLQTGIVSTVAGNGSPGFNDGFVSTSQLSVPIGITIDNDGNLLIADAANHSIRRLLTASNFLLTVSGFNGAGFTDGASGFAQFDFPYDLVTDTEGDIYVADAANNSIRKISNDITTTLAGNGSSGLQNGTGDQARFDFPTGIVRISDTEYWICDFNNNRIRIMEIN